MGKVTELYPTDGVKTGLSGRRFFVVPCPWFLSICVPPNPVCQAQVLLALSQLRAGYPALFERLPFRDRGKFGWDRTTFGSTEPPSV